MDLQSWFYIIGIIYMVVFIVLMIIIAVAFFLIIRVIKKAPENAASFIENIVGSRKNQFISMAVASIASFIFSKLKKRINKT